MRRPRRPDGNLDLAFLQRGLGRGNFSHDRRILLPQDNWQASNTAAMLGSLAAHDQRLRSNAKWP